MMKLPSLLLLALIPTLGLCGAAKPNLNKPKKLEKIIEEAIDHSELESRSHHGELPVYIRGSQKPFSGWFKRMHASGAPSLLCQYKDGKLHGLETTWDEEGNIANQTKWEDCEQKSVTNHKYGVPEQKIRKINVDEQITYGQFASKYGSSTTQINELNGLSLSADTTLAKGSELYVPIPSSKMAQQKNRGEDPKHENTEKIEIVPNEAIQDDGQKEKGSQEMSGSIGNPDNDTNTQGYFISPSLDAVHIRYSNKVNGYKVEALWSPTEIEFQDDFYFAKGPAILKLVHENGGIITVVNNYFTLRGESVAGLDLEHKDGTPISIGNQDLTLHYSDPQIPEEMLDLGSHFEPFFFYDVNFDGKKELILVEDKEGQRYRDAYKAYEINSYNELESSLYQITHREPFNDLDSGTIINRENKTITQHISAGASDSYEVIYTLNADESRQRSWSRWTKSEIHLEHNKYPEPPEGIEKLDEMPEQIIGKIKRSPDGKKDYFLTSGLGDSHALCVNFIGNGQDWYSYVSPALDFWLITKGKHKGNVIIELRQEEPATSVTGSSNWLWLISPYGEKLQPLGSMDSVDWDKMEAIYGVKK